MKKFIVTLAALLSVALLSGQQNFAYALQTGSAINGLCLTGINLETGNKICVTTFPDIHSTESSFSGIFAKTGVFYFLGHDDDDGMETYLYSVDLHTGSIISNPEISESPTEGYLKELQVDQVSGTLYALERKTFFNPSSLALVSVDPVSGTKTKITNLPSMEGIQLGFSALNSLTGKYYYMGMDTSMVWRLYTIDVNNGVIINDPVIEQDPANGYINELSINSTTGELYALHRTSGLVPDVSLVLLDPATGTQSYIATVPNVYIIQNSFSAISSADDIYYFASQDENSNYILNSIKLPGGEMINQVPFDEIDLDNNMYELQIPALMKEAVQHENLYLCKGDSALLSLPDNYDTYEWSNGATTPSIYVSDSSSYSAVLTETNIGYTTTNMISLKMYDCSKIQDTVMFNANTCSLNNAIIDDVYTDNITIENDLVYLNWNFVLQDGQTIQLEAVYDFPHNGSYVIGCQVECSSRDESQQKIYYDILDVSHLGNTLSIDENSEMDFNAYPNPASTQLNLDLNNEYKNITVELLSLNGQLIYKNLYDNTRTINMNVSGLQAGFYLVKVSTEKETKMTKVIIR